MLQQSILFLNSLMKHGCDHCRQIGITAKTKHEKIR